MKKGYKILFVLLFIFGLITCCKEKTESKYNFKKWSQQPIFINPKDVTQKCGENILEFYRNLNEKYKRCDKDTDCTFANEGCNYGCHLIFNNKFRNEFSNDIARLNNCLPKKCLVLSKCDQDIKENLKCIENQCVLCEGDSCFYDYNRRTEAVQEIRGNWEFGFGVQAH